MLGVYYLTKEKKKAKGAGRTFGDIEEVLLAHGLGHVETLAPIRMRYTGELIDLTTVYDDQDITHTERQEVENELISTTVGALMPSSALCAFTTLVTTFSVSCFAGPGSRADHFLRAASMITVSFFKASATAC